MANAFILLALISFALLVLGLIKPQLFAGLFHASRKKIALAFGGGFVLFFVLFGITSDATKGNATAPNGTKQASLTASKPDGLPSYLNADTIRAYAEGLPLQFYFDDEEKKLPNSTEIVGYANAFEKDRMKTSHISIEFDKASRKISYVAVYIVEDSYNIPPADIDRLTAFINGIDSTAGKFVNKNIIKVYTGKRFEAETDFENPKKGLHFQIIESISDAKALEKRDGKQALAHYDYYFGAEITPTQK